MRAKRPLSLLAAAVTIIALAAVGATLGTGTDKKAPPKTGFVKGKVVTGDRPEAGVWVIAETDDLPTPYRKIVVTDGKGRFVIPELPEAGYDVWVRGYGVRDSAKTPVVVGRKGSGPPVVIATEAATGTVDAANYPGNYWLSLFKPPPNTESLPGGRNANVWMGQFKLGCELCHQMGQANARGMRGNRAGLDAGLKKAGTMDARREWPRPRRPPRRARRLGRAHRRGPGPGGAASAEGHRAQPRHHPVGLGRPLHLRSRRDRHRQAQPEALPEREDLGRRPRQ